MKQKDNQNIVFGKKWFQDKQSLLLWFLNTPIIKYWFRWVMRIHDFDCPKNERITNIQPNNFTFGEKTVLTDFIVFKNGKKEILDFTKRTHKRLYKKCRIEKGFALQRTTDFRTHDKYSKRLYFAFKPFWYLLHFFDWAMLDRIEYATKFSFGFSTLTQYPGSIGTDNPVDGTVINDLTDTWANTHDAATSTSVRFGDSEIIFIQASDVNGNATRFLIVRGFFLFDTSALTAGATISAATLSICNSVVSSRQNNDSGNVDIVDCTPASDTTLATADFDQVGTTLLATSIALASWDVTDGNYNDFTLNASGIAAISKTGNSKFGARSSLDTTNTQPSLGNRLAAYFSNNTGTTKDPKLVVTYTLPTTSNMFLMF